MRSVLFLWMASIVLAGFAFAEPDDRLRVPLGKIDTQRTQPLRVPVNPCSQFGAGFARLQGSDTCVRIGGSVGIGGGISGQTMPR